MEPDRLGDSLSVDGSSGAKEIVYGTPLSHDDSAIFLPRAVAEEQANLSSALNTLTGGEVREKASPELYLEILGICGYGEFDDYARHLAIGVPVPGALEEALRQYAKKEGADLPEDDWPFEPGDIGAYADGDWPPDLLYLMYELLPEPVVVTVEGPG